MGWVNQTLGAAITGFRAAFKAGVALLCALTAGFTTVFTAFTAGLLLSFTVVLTGFLTLLLILEGFLVAGFTNFLTWIFALTEDLADDFF
jgi:hypothetical protein